MSMIGALAGSTPVKSGDPPGDATRRQMTPHFLLSVLSIPWIGR